LGFSLSLAPPISPPASAASTRAGDESNIKAATPPMITTPSFERVNEIREVGEIMRAYYMRRVRMVDGLKANAVAGASKVVPDCLGLHPGSRWLASAVQEVQT